MTDKIVSTEIDLSSVVAFELPLFQALRRLQQAGEVHAKRLSRFGGLTPMQLMILQVLAGEKRLTASDLSGRVSLTLLIGDALEQLPQLDATIDAWFLDGFAPQRNPQMWCPELFAELARLSHPGTTLGTYCSAGDVRRGLKAAGFSMRRVPGIGRKWEVLKGQFNGPASSAGKPWFARPSWRPAVREALVIGAGLAGCATAASLAARGWQAYGHAGPTGSRQPTRRHR